MVQLLCSCDFRAIFDAKNLWASDADGMHLCLSFQRYGGSGIDKVWDRVEEVVERNLHGNFHRCCRSGFEGHVGYLREGVKPTATCSASMTMSVGGGTCICNQVEIIIPTTVREGVLLFFYQLLV